MYTHDQSAQWVHETRRKKFEAELKRRVDPRVDPIFTSIESVSPEGEVSWIGVLLWVPQLRLQQVHF